MTKRISLVLVSLLGADKGNLSVKIRRYPRIFTFFFLAQMLFLSMLDIGAVYGAYIENVETNRNPPIVSVNSFQQNLLIDGTWDLRIVGVYVTAKVVNDSDKYFTGVLRFRQGDSWMVDVFLKPNESKDYVIKLPNGVVTTPREYHFALDLKDGPCIWNQTLNTWDIVVQVNDKTSPTYNGPKVLGKNLLLNTSIEDEPDLADKIINVVDLFCSLLKVITPPVDPENPVIGSCFNTDNYELGGNIKENIKESAHIAILPNILSPEYIRHLIIRGFNYGNPDFQICYDRAVMMITFPSNVTILSSTPMYDLQIAGDNSVTYAWIFNNVDKLFAPQPYGNGGNIEIELFLQEPPTNQYEAQVVFLLQFGPFGNSDDFTDKNKVPTYDYLGWNLDGNTVNWLTISSAVLEESFSTYAIDQGKPSWISAPVAMVVVPDYRATQINLSELVSYDDISKIIFSSIGQSVANVDINNTTKIATITVPEGWIGKEEITFVAEDEQGRTVSIGGHITSVSPQLLQEGKVAPVSGLKDDLFTFSVIYRNPTNTYPQKALVVVNNIPYNMKKKIGSPAIKDGAEFVLDKLGSSIATDGNNVFFFEFESDSQTFRYPQQSVLEGPEISITHDVAITGLQIDPNEPEQGQPCSIYFRVENVGSIIEWDLTARLFVDGNEVYSGAIRDVGVADTSKIIMFQWTPPVRDDEHEYELKVCVDVVSGETNTANNCCSLFETVKPKYGQVSGWVLDQFNNAVEDAFIKVISSSAEEYGSTKTEHDGWYFLDGLMPGDYTLEARKDGEGTAIKANVSVHSLQETENQVFNLSLTETNQVTSGKYLTYTACSPNGQKLAFTQALGSPDTYLALHRVNADGTGLTRLTGPDKPAYDAAYGRPEFSPDPDGTKILFAARHPTSGFGIWVTSASGNGSDATKIISETSTTIPRYPTWAPDGRRIAYRKDLTNTNPRTYKIYIYDTVTHTDTFLRDGEYVDLTWSPDGNWIACSGLTYLINAATGAQRPISVSPNEVIYPCWLPDSSGLVYEYIGVWLYYLETGERIQITFDQPQDYARYPSVPRNSANKLAFISHKGFVPVEDYGLFTMPFSPPRLYFTNISRSPETFTPNGDELDDLLYIFYTINRPAYVTLKIHDSQGGFVAALADNELQDANTHQITWDGKNLYGLMQNDEVYFYRLDMHDANETAVPAHGRTCMVKNWKNMGAGVLYPRWSHSGEKIVYWDNRETGTIWITDVNHPSNKQLVPTPFPVQTGRPAWSRDDQQVVFPTKRPEQATQIAKVNLDGTGYTELTTYSTAPDSLKGGAWPMWSESNDVIVFDGYWNDPNFYYVSKINSDGTGLQQLSYGCEGRPAAPTWSPDGNKIAWCSDISGNREIWIMNSDGSDKENLTFHPYEDSYPEFTPDGKRLLFFSARQNGLWTEPLDDSDGPRCIYAYGGSGVPSPDGSKILCGNGDIIELFISLTKGTIEGKVYDANNLDPVAEAVVSLKQDSNEILQTVTNTEGAYQFSNIVPGTYAIDVNVPGYIPETCSAEAYSWCFTRDIDFSLVTKPTVTISSIIDDEIIHGEMQLFAEGNPSDISRIVYEYSPADVNSGMSLFLQTLEQSGEPRQWTQIGSSDPYHPLQWDVGTLPSGNYLVRAVAYDEQGNADDSPQIISVVVDSTAPKAYLSNVHDSELVSGLVELVAETNDADVASVSFEYKPHENVIWTPLSVCTSTPYTVHWDTINLFKGEYYDLRAIAIDTHGNVDDSPNVVSVIVIESVSHQSCDFSEDGVINFTDFALLAMNWLRADCNEDNNWCDQSDVDHLGSVSLDDLLFFSANWLWKEPEKTPDLNNDRIVNFMDFAVFSNNWMSDCIDPEWCHGCDFDESGQVDFVDFEFFAQHWLQEF